MKYCNKANELCNYDSNLNFIYLQTTRPLLLWAKIFPHYIKPNITYPMTGLLKTTSP